MRICVFVCVLLPLALGDELHEVAEANDIDEINSLVELGASIDAQDDEGRAPLQVATEAGRTEARVLLATKVLRTKKNEL